MREDYMNKTAAVNYISLQTGFGRRVVEKALDQLQQEGRIKLITTSYSRLIHISKQDVELVINILNLKTE